MNKLTGIILVGLIILAALPITNAIPRENCRVREVCTVKLVCQTNHKNCQFIFKCGPIRICEDVCSLELRVIKTNLIQVVERCGSSIYMLRTFTNPCAAISYLCAIGGPCIARPKCIV